MLILLHEAIPPLPNGTGHANRSIKVVLETCGELGVDSEHSYDWLMGRHNRSRSDHTVFLPKVLLKLSANHALLLQVRLEDIHPVTRLRTAPSLVVAPFPRAFASPTPQRASTLVRAA